MNSKFFIGWELMLHSMEEDIRKKEDLIMALIHWVLIKSRFRCIGLNDDSTGTDETPGSELLPERWNKKETFGIKYKMDDQILVLEGQVANEEFVINLVRILDEHKSTIKLKPGDLVTACSGGLETMVPKCAELAASVRTQLVAPLVATTSHEASVQTSLVGAHPPASRIACESLLGTSPRQASETNLQYMHPPGGSDVDPFPLTAPGQGMLFDPFNSGSPRPLNPGAGEPGTIPSGAIPPGARIDPRAEYGVGSSDLHPFPHQLLPGRGSVFYPFNRVPRPLDPGAGVPGSLPRGAVPPGARFDPFGPLGIGPRPQRQRYPPESDELLPEDFENMFL